MIEIHILPSQREPKPALARRIPVARSEIAASLRNSSHHIRAKRRHPRTRDLRETHEEKNKTQAADTHQDEAKRNVRAISDLHSTIKWGKPLASQSRDPQG